jgi:hypothetical protein
MMNPQLSLKADHLYEGWNLDKKIPIKFKYLIEPRTVEYGLVMKYILLTFEDCKASYKDFPNREQVVDYIFRNYSVWNNT